MPPNNLPPSPCLGTACLPSPTPSHPATPLYSTPPSGAPLFMGAWVQIIHCFVRGCYLEVQPAATSTATATIESVATQSFGTQSPSTSSSLPFLTPSPPVSADMSGSTIQSGSAAATPLLLGGDIAHGSSSDPASAKPTNLNSDPTSAETPTTQAVIAPRRVPALTGTSTSTLAVDSAVFPLPVLSAETIDGISPTLIPVSYVSSGTVFSVAFGMGAVATLLVSALCWCVAQRRQRRAGASVYDRDDQLTAARCHGLRFSGSSLLSGEDDVLDGKDMFGMAGGRVTHPQRDAGF